MPDFIEDFYYGNIEPQECTTNLTAKVKKNLSELADKEEQLAAKDSVNVKLLYICNFFSELSCADHISTTSKPRALPSASFVFHLKS